MKKIYENLDITRVGHFQSILEGEGIATLLKNMGTSSLMGEVPMAEAYPELWVVEDEQYDRALEILKPFYRSDASSAGPWTCSGCGEVLEEGFGQCWNCGAMRVAPPVGPNSRSSAVE